MSTGGGVEGKVKDRNGRPVAGVAVVALAPMAMSGMAGSPSEGALYEGQSDVEGRYRIVHMAAGTYFLFATRGDEALHPMSFLGRMNLDMVSVPKGETVRYDLVDSTSGGCRVHGRVLDAGVPVVSGVLMATAAEGTGSLGIDMKMARLSAEGRFEFPGLAPGSWQIGLEGQNEVRMRLEVPDQAELAVDLSIPEGGLEGSVVDAATGEPVPDADVHLRPLDVPRPKGLLAMVVRQGDEHSASTDEHGAFSVARLCAGEYELSVETRSREKGAKRYAPSDPILVRIDEGRIERDRVVRLSTPMSMSGVVRGEDGQPIAGADVSARRQDRSGGRAERTSTDANGAFELGGLAPGVYAVEASAKDHASDAVRDVRLESGAKPVEIRLRRGVAVSVRVYQGDGRPASGARAVLSRGGGGSDLDAHEADHLLEEIFKGQGISDAEGKIELGRFLPGDYELEVTRGTSVSQRVSIRGDRTEVEIRADLP
jgi:protocatechuate 3,4-dioxygenase beta subunit